MEVKIPWLVVKVAMGGVSSFEFEGSRREIYMEWVWREEVLA